MNAQIKVTPPQAQHTPGPWRRAETNESPFTDKVYGADNYIVAACGTKREGSVDSANARLIAAAPELLEALISTHDYFVNYLKWLMTVPADENLVGAEPILALQNAITAITKAKGE